jgi:hypothetical protein
VRAGKVERSEGHTSRELRLRSRWRREVRREKLGGRWVMPLPWRWSSCRNAEQVFRVGMQESSTKDRLGVPLPRRWSSCNAGMQSRYDDMQSTYANAEQECRTAGVSSRNIEKIGETQSNSK